MIVSINNDQLKVSVKLLGAEICSVVDCKTGKEYIWKADPNYWARQAPVLFPFVGSLKDKKYECKGNTYEMVQHGFARDMEFRLEKETNHELWFSLRSNESTRAIYPYDFQFNIGYRLDGRTLTVMYEVLNPSDETIYFGLGAHPGFPCNFDEEDYYFRFPNIKNLSSFFIDPKSGCRALTPKEVALNKIEEEYAYLKLTKELFEADALIVEQSGIYEVALCKGEREVVKASFDAPLFGLWSPAGKNAPFVCIEPWYGRCDRVDSSYDITSKDYINALIKGETFKKSYQLEFYESF